jgi:hypothetical protein
VDRFVPKPSAGDRLKKILEGTGDALEEAAAAQRERADPDDRDPRGPGVTTMYLIAPNANPHDVRAMDLGTRYVHPLDVRNVAIAAFAELAKIARPAIENLSADPIEIVFGPGEEYGNGQRIPTLSLWTLEGVFDLADAAVVSALIDVSDRPTRELGRVSPAAGSLWDVSDRVGRLLGIIASITATVAADVTDRTTRKLGQVFLRRPDDFVNMGDSTTPLIVNSGNDAQAISGTIFSAAGHPFNEIAAGAQLRYGSALVVLDPLVFGSVGYAGVDLVFEATLSGGIPAASSWFPFPGRRIDTGAIESAPRDLVGKTYTRFGTPIRDRAIAWEFSLGVVAQLRVRATRFDFGSASVGFVFSPVATSIAPTIRQDPASRWNVSAELVKDEAQGGGPLDLELSIMRTIAETAQLEELGGAWASDDGDRLVGMRGYTSRAGFSDRGRVGTR